MVGTITLALAAQPGTAPGRSESDGTRSEDTPTVQQAPSPEPAAEFWTGFGSFSRNPKLTALPVPTREPSVELPASRPGRPDEVFVPDVLAHDEQTIIQLSGSPAIDAFSAGYLGAGGNGELLRHIVEDVIPCEYGWEPYYPKNKYMSRAQFDPYSWAKAGNGDPADDYQVGGNVARWIALIADPGSGSGWPVCWHKGGW